MGTICWGRTTRVSDPPETEKASIPVKPRFVVRPSPTDENHPLGPDHKSMSRKVRSGFRHHAWSFRFDRIHGCGSTGSVTIVVQPAKEPARGIAATRHICCMVNDSPRRNGAPRHSGDRFGTPARPESRLQPVALRKAVCRCVRMRHDLGMLAECKGAWRGGMTGQLPGTAMHNRLFRTESTKFYACADFALFIFYT